MGRARYRRAFVIAVLVAVCAFAGLRVALAALEGEPDARGATVTRFELRGPGGGRLEQIAIRPAAARERPPLLVFLHGRTDDLDGPGSTLSQAMLDGLADLGADAPAVLLVNGGKSSYFHDRRGGDWGTYVLRRAIPAGLRRLRADPGRVAIGGISMGGFGALHLAGRRRFCAVGGHSPALWLSGGETPPGAFDDGEDFDRTTPLVHRPLGGRVWLDVGTDDPFREATRELGRRLGERVRVWSGGHDGDYWDAHMGAYLRFYARALRSCP